MSKTITLQILALMTVLAPVQSFAQVPQDGSSESAPAVESPVGGAEPGQSGSEKNDAPQPTAEASSERRSGDTPPKVQAALPEPSMSDEARFRKSQNLFQFGDCSAVVALLNPYTLRAEGKPRAKLIEAHRMLGVCYYQLGKPDASDRELNSLLYVDPDYVLDPLVTPPPLIERFAALKAELREKLREIKRARQKREDERKVAQNSQKVLETRAVQRDSIFLAFVPFGVPQFSHGQNTAGVIFAFLQGIPLAANLAMFSGLQVVRETTLVQDRDTRLALEYGLWGGHLLAAAAFGLAYLGGVAHAMFWLPDEIVLEESRTVVMGDENAKE